MGWELVRYFVLAKFRNGHGVHSPVVYEFATQVLYAKGKSNKYKEIESLISGLKKDKTKILYNELGSGTRGHKKKQYLSVVAKTSGIRKKYGRLLNRIIAHYKPSAVLELGTCVGMSTMYLATACEKSTIYTIEGNSSLVEHAQRNAELLSLSNIKFYSGLFDELLPKLIENLTSSSIVFIDGNHTYEATLKYYTQLKEVVTNGILIFDDIYWSRGMAKAWQEISENEDVSIDLYQFGIIIRGERLTPGYYRFRYLF